MFKRTLKVIKLSPMETESQEPSSLWPGDKMYTEKMICFLDDNGNDIKTKEIL